MTKEIFNHNQYTMGLTSDQVDDNDVDFSEDEDGGGDDEDSDNDDQIMTNAYDRDGGSDRTDDDKLIVVMSVIHVHK